MKDMTAPRLAVVVIGGNILFAILIFACSILWLFLQTQEVKTDAQRASALRGAEAMRTTFTEAIEREWNSLGAVVRNVDISQADTRDQFVNAAADASYAVTWAGIADPGGTIIAGSRDWRVGEDVSNAEWFRDGLRGKSVGDVFASDQSDELDQTFLNFSRPVLGPDGLPQAVVVYRVSLGWVRGYVQNVADTFGLDAFIVDRDGRVVASDTNLFGNELLEEERNQATGPRRPASVLTDTSSTEFVSAFASNVGGLVVPDLGWNLIVRVPANDPDAPGFLDELRSTWGMGLLIAALSLVYALISGLVLRPIAELVRVAEGIANGEEVYPRENASSAEAASLSSTLAKLQTRLQSAGYFSRD